MSIQVDPDSLEVLGCARMKAVSLRVSSRGLLLGQSVVWFFRGTLLVGGSHGSSRMSALSVAQSLFAGIGQLTS